MRQKIRVLLAVSSIIGLIFGLGLLIAPAPLLRLYGLDTDDTGLLLARLLGVELIGYNLVGWIARSADPQPADSTPRAVVWGHVVSETLGALVTAWAAARGLGHPMLWGVVALYAVLAAAFLWASLALRESRVRAA
jgi:Na+-driven multidrug efflux pump